MIARLRSVARELLDALRPVRERETPEIRQFRARVAAARRIPRAERLWAAMPMDAGRRP